MSEWQWAVAIFCGIGVVVVFYTKLEGVHALLKEIRDALQNRPGGSPPDY